MTRYTHNPAALSLSNGTAQTFANSGGAAGTALTPAGTAPTFQSGVWRASTTSGVASRSDMAITASSQVSVEAKFNLTALPVGGNNRAIEFYTGANYAGRLDFLTDGKVRLYDSTNGSIWTSTHAYAAGSVPRIHSGVQSLTTSTGKYRVTLYEGDSTTPLETMPAIDNGNAGASFTISTIRFLKITTAGSVGLELVNAQVDNAQITAIGPLVVSSPPTVVVTGDGTYYIRRDFTGSTAVSPDTSVSHSAVRLSGTDAGTIRETADGLYYFPVPTTGSTVYRETTTASPSGLTTTTDITVAAPVGGAVTGVVRKTYNGTSWV